MSRFRSLSALRMGPLLVLLLTMLWVLIPATASAQQERRVPCKVELLLTEVEVVKDTDAHVEDKWEFTIDAKKRDATGTYSSQFTRDKGKEGYDIDVIPFQASGALKREVVPMTVTIKVKELDHADGERGRNGSDTGTQTHGPVNLTCPAPGQKLLVPFTVTVPVPPNPAAPAVPAVEKDGELKFSFICVLND